MKSIEKVNEFGENPEQRKSIFSSISSICQCDNVSRHENSGSSQTAEKPAAGGSSRKTVTQEILGQSVRGNRINEPRRRWWDGMVFWRRLRSPRIENEPGEELINHENSEFDSLVEQHLQIAADNCDPAGQSARPDWLKHREHSFPYKGSQWALDQSKA